METYITANPQMIWTGECMVRVCVFLRKTIIIILLEEQSDGTESAFSKQSGPPQASAPLSFFMRTHIRTQTCNYTHTHVHTNTETYSVLLLVLKGFPSLLWFPPTDVMSIHQPLLSSSPFCSLSPPDLHSSPLYSHYSFCYLLCLSPLSSFLPVVSFFNTSSFFFFSSYLFLILSWKQFFSYFIALNPTSSVLLLLYSPQLFLFLSASSPLSCSSFGFTFSSLMPLVSNSFFHLLLSPF